MPDDRGTLREIAWRELFPWLILFRTVRPALDPRKLLLAALAIVFTSIGWWALGRLFEGSDDPGLRQAIQERDYWPWQGARLSGEAPFWPPQSFFPMDDGVHPMLDPWVAFVDPFVHLFSVDLTLAGFTYFLLCALWATAVWALAASAITRIAAVELALEERLGLGRAISFARSHWVSCFWAPVFPLLGVLLAVVFMALGGWLLRFDSTIILIALVWPLYLVAGLVMAILLLGLAFGWPLMWPAISSEGTDLFDGISRSYSYIFQRPLHYLFYVVVAALFGVLAWFLIWMLGAAVVQLSFWGASWTSGAARTSDVMSAVSGTIDIQLESSSLEQIDIEPGTPSFHGLGRAGIGLLAFWVGCVRVLTLGFAFSYFWVASTAIYLLLRRAADAKEMDEVYTDVVSDTHGLPPLPRDAAGVPVAPHEPTNSNGESPDDLASPPPGDDGH